MINNMHSWEGGVGGGIFVGEDNMCQDQPYFINEIIDIFFLAK